ncbi:CsbD family protein [Brevundimonas sp. LjRoot202]|uniref:CsbD family protein n=1 Tax=Brevundimonas sp. LjRoot202 TaxID=3342281 RepID=UPI003ED0E60A
MTDQRIEGAATETEGQIQNGLGRMTGDRKMQLEGKVNEVKGKALDAYGRVIDGLDGLVEKAPAQYQGRARQGLDFARRKPLLTTGIVAGLAVLLGGLGGRRRHR